MSVLLVVCASGEGAREAAEEEDWDEFDFDVEDEVDGEGPR